jgi:hypothetical protein
MSEFVMDGPLCCNNLQLNIHKLFTSLHPSEDNRMCNHRKIASVNGPSHCRYK